MIFHTKMPPSYPTFLVDGQVAGTWKYVDGAVAHPPFEPLTREAAAGGGGGGRRSAAFHGGALNRRPGVTSAYPDLCALMPVLRQPG